MRRGKATLTLLAVFALVVMTSSGAFASTTQTADAYAPFMWSTPEKVDTTITYSFTQPTGTSLILYGFAAPTTQKLTLTAGTNKTVAIAYKNDKGTKFFQATAGTTSISIGNGILNTDTGQQKSQFGFAFTSGTGTSMITYYNYTVAGNTLTNWQTGISVTVTGPSSLTKTGRTHTASNPPPPPPNPVPLPGSVLLFGSGLLGLIGIRSRRKSKS